MFKLITFQNTAINRTGITELVTRQNDLLHRTIATTVVNVDTAVEIYNLEEEGEDYYEGTIREWAISAKTDSNNYLFYLVEPGQK